MDYGNGDGDQGFDDQRRVLSGVSSEMMKRPRFFSDARSWKEIRGHYAG